jgi:hypothetical protein
MPDDRPDNLTCYAERTPQFSLEAEQIKRGVVVLPSEQEIDFTLDEIVDFVAATGLVTAQVISVGRLAGMS